MKGKILSFNSKVGEIKKFNSQFHSVKVYVAYAGKNRNGSYISKETFEEMIPSLYGVPIVGEWKEDDFGSHGGKIEISDDGVEYIETTKPYGYVDSSATVQWETVEEDDGTERDYLTVSAFLWTGRYPEALKILENKNNQSMEINVYDGDFTEKDGEEYFEITDGEFSALCLLGEEITPCFESAKVSQFNLNKDKFKAEFSEMVAELKQSFAKSELEGGDKMKEKKVEKVVAEVTEVDEVDGALETEEVEVTEIEDTNESDVTATEDKAEDVVEDVAETETETETETEVETAEVDSFTKTFELSHDDIRSKLYGLLSKVEEDDNSWYYISEVFNDHFIYSGYDSSNETIYFKQGYISTDVDVALSGDRVEMFIEFLTKTELETLNTIRKEHALFSEELETLRAFKAEKDQEALELKEEELRTEKIDYINKEYPNLKKDVKDLFIGRVDEYKTNEDIDADICVYIIKNKVSFSKAKKETGSAKAGIDLSDSDKGLSPYGDIFNYK